MLIGCTGRLGVLIALGMTVLVGTLQAEELKYKERVLGQLVGQVPGILETFDAETGRFGEGIWICRDQHPMYPLAVAYTTQAESNPYYHDPELLAVIVKSGDPLIENLDERGQWIFAKKDGSTWGKIWMPWTYSRWVRTFGLVRDRMPPEARKAWSDALLLGFTGISEHCMGHLHNIPCHHAMGLYIAGQVFERPEWQRKAAKFMQRVVASQSEGGYWSEGGGPVVVYDFVYVDAVGTYYAASGDKRVLRSLERASVFHRRFTYPGGQNVETIDQRNPYHDTVVSGNVGFTFSPAGRSFLKNQWSQLAAAGDGSLSADLIASLLLYGEEGPLEATGSGGAEEVFVLSEGGVDRAATIRRGPWFVCLSAYTTPIARSRWIQDRQNMVSIYHDRTGLILGGGNTKLQPAWSTFTVGDPSLLSHTAGDIRPKFVPAGDLFHVPSSASLVTKPEPGLDLVYGEETCRVRLLLEDDHALKYRIEASANGELPVIAHLPLMPHLGQVLETGGGEKVTLSADPIELSPEQVGGVVALGGYRLHLPACASLHWPALPHNPYRKDGRATVKEGLIEIRVLLDGATRSFEVSLEIVDRDAEP